jgi:multidrug transporter EmrE-like cation transporter
MVAMGLIIGGSIAFSIGGAFMPASKGFTRVVPSFVVAVAFVIGAIFLARAVLRSSVSTTMLIGIGFEALATVAIGRTFLDERVSAT